MFVYTRDDKVIRRLEHDKCPLIKILTDETYVFAIPPTSNYSFAEFKETKIMNKLTF